MSNFHKNNNNSGFFKNFIIWIIIFLSLICLYAFRFELDYFKNRVLSVLIPFYSWENKNGELVIARTADGHFYIKAYGKNKKEIKFLIDTGATDIALTRKDAIKLGINLKKLRYTRKYNTANGVSYAAPIRLNQLTLGSKTFYNLQAHVPENDKLDISLLGMSLIGQFDSFTIDNDMLLLKY